MEKISQNVYAEVGGRGCNHSFVVTREGLVMIDTPMFPSDAIKWRETMARFGPVRYLVNTEPHGDHTSGNWFFDGIVIAHEGTRKAILDSTVKQYQDMLGRMSPPGEAVPEGFKYKPPTITFSHKLTFYLGDHTFQLINLPGHSPFQVVVHVPEERIAFTSDNVTYGNPPAMHQALPFEWIQSLKEMRKLEIDRMVPGHGGICGPAYLTEMIEIVQGAIDAVISAKKKGMSLEEATKKLSLFPRFPKDERSQQFQLMSIARLYGILNG